jgi:hypothetical protein
MRFAAKDHNNSVAPILSAMVELGYIPDGENPELILIDHDSPPYYRHIIDQYPGATILLYPHGDPYMFAWDGIWEVNQRTAGYLSSNIGAAEIMRRYGYPKPIQVIGWYRCEQRAFAPTDKIERVVFAPIHPLNNGYLNKYHKQANIKAYKALLEMPIQLVVRHIDSLPANGLWPVGGVEYIDGRMDGSTTPADIVITNVGTYLATTVAQGKPVVAYGQDYPILDGHDDDSLRFSQHWDDYKDYLRYAYDIEDGFYALEKAACVEAAVWREKFIGEQFTTRRLERALECLNI